MKLAFGAVLIPVKRTRQGEVDNSELIEYLLSVRKAKCVFKDECIDALANQDYCLGFSCEKCPLNRAK